MSTIFDRPKTGLTKFQSKIQIKEFQSPYPNDTQDLQNLDYPIFSDLFPTIRKLLLRPQRLISIHNIDLFLKKCTTHKYMSRTYFSSYTKTSVSLST